MIYRQVLITSAIALCFTTAGLAQSGQISFAGSYLKGTENNKAGLWGGGITLKGFLGNNAALGASVSSYPKKTSSATVGNFKYNYADIVTNASASLDLLLSPKTAAVQPYIGTDAGISFNSQTVSYTNSNNAFIENKNKASYFLLAPKIGMNIGLSKAFGIFGQAQYNFNFGDGNSVSYNEAPVQFNSEPVTKYLTFDAGIYFRFMPASTN